MLVYFDTVRRKRSVKEGGELIQLDWAHKNIMKTIPLFPSEPDIENDPNPRGNSRGGKGIVLHNNELFVGTYHTILVFDLHLRFKRKITNNLFVNIHEMDLDGENIWVSSTAIDCALLVDQDGNTVKSWWPRENSLLQRRFELRPLKIDKQADNRLTHLHKEVSIQEGHTHLNCITKHGEKTYVLLNKLGVLVQIEPVFKVIVEDQRLRGGHSVKVLKNDAEIALCRSFRHTLLICDLNSGKLTKEIELLKFDTLKKLQENSPDQSYSKSLFIRGLTILDAEKVLIGVSPASILEVDIRHDRLLDFYQYSSDVSDAIHGLIHV